MTKEILAMEPGPELDTLVAEKIMDHPMPDFIPEDALNLYLVGAPIHYDSWTCVCRYDEGDVPKWVPAPYSTDISAAWLVVEKMFELGHSMSLLHLSSEFYPDYWYCDFRLKGKTTPPAYEWVDHISKAPEAISKAALIATDAGK